MKHQTLKGTTGHLYEDQCLYPHGRAPQFPDASSVDYQPFRKAIIDAITRHNGYRIQDLSDPPSLWMSDVLFCVAEELRVDMECLKVFPTRGTSADVHHGVDFFITFFDPKTQQEVIVTVDISENSIKAEQGYKADLIVSSSAVSPNPHFYPLLDFQSVTRKDYSSKKDDIEYEKNHRKLVAHTIAQILKEKMHDGDMHYDSLYNSHRYGDPLTFKDEIRNAIEDVMNSSVAPHRKRA